MEFLQETRVVAYFFAFAASFLHTVQCIGPVSSKKYDLCRVQESTPTAIGMGPVRSVLECITLCAAHGSCRSVTICEHDLTKTCSLLPTSPPCPSIPSGDTCFLAQVYDVCQNGGIFNTATVRCDCSLGWQGDRCQTPTATSQTPFTSSTTASTATTTPTSTISTTAAYVPTTTNSPYGCMSGPICFNAGLKNSYSGVTYCCSGWSLPIISLDGSTCTC